MQPLFEITSHPLDLSRFGKNPAGKPLYRIVVASTRIMKLAYEGKRHELPMYELGDKWILERWTPAEIVIGGSRRAYEEFVKTMKLPQVPYPTDGEYEHCHTFPGTIDPQDAYAFISVMEFQRNNFSNADRKEINDENQVVRAELVDKARTHVLENAMERTHAE